MNQSNEYLSEFPKLSHMFLYKGNELADFLTHFLEQMRAFLNEVDYYKEKQMGLLQPMTMPNAPYFMRFAMKYTISIRPQMRSEMRSSKWVNQPSGRT